MPPIRFERVFETVMPATVEQLWEFHASAEALRILTPPKRELTPVSNDLSVRNGALHVMRFKQFGLTMEWRARISEVNPQAGFVDTAEKSPFAYWQHRHRFLPSPAGSILRDELNYSLPGGPFANLINRLFVQKDLETLFQFRHEMTANYFKTRVEEAAR